MLPDVRRLVDQIPVGNRGSGNVDDVAGRPVAAGAGDDRGVLADAHDRSRQRVAEHPVEQGLLVIGQRAADAQPRGLVERVQIRLQGSEVGDVLFQSPQPSLAGPVTEQSADGSVAGAALQREHALRTGLLRGQPGLGPSHGRRGLLGVIGGRLHRLSLHSGTARAAVA